MCNLRARSHSSRLQEMWISEFSFLTVKKMLFTDHLLYSGNLSCKKGGQDVWSTSCTSQLGWTPPVPFRVLWRGVGGGEAAVVMLPVGHCDSVPRRALARHIEWADVIPISLTAWRWLSSQRRSNSIFLKPRSWLLWSLWCISQVVTPVHVKVVLK